MNTMVVCAMLADLLTFALVVPVVGIANELNPVMRLGYEQYGLSIVVALKLLCLLVMLLLIMRVRRRRPKILAASIGAAIGLIGAISNVSAWWLA